MLQDAGDGVLFFMWRQLSAHNKGSDKVWRFEFVSHHSYAKSGKQVFHALLPLPPVFSSSNHVGDDPAKSDTRAAGIFLFF